MPMTKNTSHRTLTWATTGGGAGGVGYKHQQGVLEILTSPCAASTQKTGPQSRPQHLPSSRKACACADSCCSLWEQNLLFVLSEGMVFPESCLMLRNMAQGMTPGTQEETCILKWLEMEVPCARYRDPWPGVIADARGPVYLPPVRSAICASLLVKETHRSAECLPERDTLLPTGEGRLLPLCRSSMDLLQGFDLSTELSMVLSTLSKSNLKQKRNATRDWEIHIDTNTWMCIT